MLQVDRLEKELRARDTRLGEQSEILSGLRVEVSETRLNAQVAIDELRYDLMASQNLLKASQVLHHHPSTPPASVIPSECSISGRHLIPGSIHDLQGTHRLNRHWKSVTTDTHPCSKAVTRA